MLQKCRRKDAVYVPHTAGAIGWFTARRARAAELVGAQQYLSSVAEPLRRKGQIVAVQPVVGLAAAAIARLAREQHADAIAMATHGRSGLARIVLGSVATGVLQQACLPLLLVRPPALR
ncbi:MAG: universal stress protein [Chloroflexi bacterium]|nr:universal stress protein [Chloroflexota bacterium]